MNAQIQIKTDQLGFEYILFSDKLVRSESSPFPQFQISLLTYGLPSDIDLTNPLRPFVFFKDQGTIVFLDNELNLAGNLFQLNTTGSWQISACCSSKGNAFWMYDQLNRQLIQMNRENEILLKSARLEINEEITQLIENEIQLFGVGSNGVLYQFNLFGNLIIKFDLNVFQIIQLSKGLVAITNEGILLENIAGIWQEKFSLKNFMPEQELLYVDRNYLVRYNKVSGVRTREMNLEN
jgi:hypothetical protein